MQVRIMLMLEMKQLQWMRMMMQKLTSRKKWINSVNLRQLEWILMLVLLFLQ
jgi:hypothetical protein